MVSPWDVDPLFLYLLGTAALRHLLTWSWRDRRPDAAVRVGTVARIILYPVKSTAGVELTEARCTYNGPMLGSTKDRSALTLYTDLTPNQFGGLVYYYVIALYR